MKHALALLTALACLSSPVAAQDFDMFAGARAKPASEPLKFETASLTNGALTQTLSPDNQAMMRFTNPDPEAVYRISVSTDTPGPIALRVLQLELDAANRATKQTPLIGGNVNTAEATTLTLAPTLLPEGDIYIGLGVYENMGATLTIQSDPARDAKPLKAGGTLKPTGDWIFKAARKETCLAPPKGRPASDVTLIAHPETELRVRTLGPARGSWTSVEDYSRTGSLDLRGLDASRFERLCILSPGARGGRSVRVQVAPASRADEPDVGLPIPDVPLLRAGATLTRSTFATDTDVVRLSPAPKGQAHQIEIGGVYGAKACVVQAEAEYPKAECYGDVRRVGPFLGGNETLLQFSDVTGGDGLYTLTSTLVPFDAATERAEPNAGVFTRDDAPERNARTGIVRIRGSHVSRSDTDVYTWADIETEQLWRVRAVGSALSGGTLKLNGKPVMRLAAKPGTTGRLSADDVFMTRGVATLELQGGTGDYSVVFKPVGPPPDGFELEQGVTGEGQALEFGQTVTGVLRAGDQDTLIMSTSKGADVSLALAPPLGARTGVSIFDAGVNETVEPGDAPLDFTLPPGNTEIVLTPKIGSPVEYTLTLSRRNGFAVKDAPLSLSLPKPAAIRAWSDAVQTVSLPVRIRNTSARSVSGTLTARTPTHLMLVTDVPISIPAKGSKTVSLPLRLLPDIAPDDYDIMVGVAGDTPLGGVTLVLPAEIDAPDTGARSQPAIPERLVGAIDLAHRDHGAKWLSIEAGTRGNFINKGPLDNLLDHLWVVQERNQASFRFDRDTVSAKAVLQLSDTPVPLVGVGFMLVSDYAIPMGEIEIETSTDGRTFRSWITGVNDHYKALQYMEGEAREATHIRLVLPKGSGANFPDWSRLSELYVYAQPGQSGLPGFDLLRHGYGAKTHLNDGTPKEQSVMKGQSDRQVSAQKIDGGPGYRITGDPISFRNVMRADVVSAGIGWTRPDAAATNRPDRVIVMGTDALSGTWRELGRADIPDPKAERQLRFEFPEAETVRFIRFDYEGPRNRMYRPAQIYAFERPESDNYLSVLGAWTGRPTRPVDDDTAVRDGGELLPDGLPVRGVVQFQDDTDRWSITPKPGANMLVLDVEGGPGFDPNVTVTQSGKSVSALSTEPQIGTMTTRHSFRITPGAPVTVEVSEDTRSVFVLANPGGELEAFRSNVLNGLVRLSGDMVAGRDSVAFSPMSATKRTPWITDPTKVTRPVLDLFKTARGGEGDSKALAATARLMAKRGGSKAIIMIGDGRSNNGDPQLETALETARARLFIAKPPGGVVDMTYAPTNDVLQGWAQIAGGDVSFDTSQAGYARMFSRASAKMRGPKAYRIAATTEMRVFEPGLLSVRSAPPLPAADRRERTQMVLLDTSGSMLKRIGDTRRFAIARSALSDYVTAQKRSDDKFDRIGLRLFGGPPQSCETELALAPAPLDGRFSSAVTKVVPQNNAKTPIAAALKAAGDDLKGVDGEVNILLLTDGEETCDGDPLAEVNALQARGIDVRLDVVSFALADNVSRQDFEAWARAGGGRYVDAQSSTELASALANTRARGFQVFDADELLAAGQVGADPISLPAGRFDIVFEGSDTRLPVTITSNKTTEFKP